jgi:hypothetical protein
MRGPHRDGVQTAGGVGLARARALAFWPCFQLVEAPFDRLKLKNFELKFKFAKYESCRPDNPLQLS